MAGNALWLLPTVFIIGFGIYAWLRTDRGKLRLHRFLLKLPIAGQLIRQMATAQLARSISTLLSGGITVPDSWEVASQALNNLELRHRSQAVLPLIREGRGFTEALEKADWIPPLGLDMIGIGERSGSLREMMDEVAIFYDAEAEVKREQVTTLLEPVILVIMAAIILVIRLRSICLSLIRSRPSDGWQATIKFLNERTQTVTTNVSSPKIELSDFLENEPPEVVEAKQLAKRYRLPYIDLLPPDADSPIDYEELAKIPVEMMLRNHFVPLKREGHDLHAAMADPTNLERLDEMENALNVRIVPYIATQGAIDVILKRGDATQRVLQEAASGFKISLVKETDQGEEVLDLDRLASDSDMSPIIKLVDTIVYNAMESRASISI